MSVLYLLIRNVGGRGNTLLSQSLSAIQNKFRSQSLSSEWVKDREGRGDRRSREYRVDEGRRFVCVGDDSGCREVQGLKAKEELYSYRRGLHIPGNAESVSPSSVHYSTNPSRTETQPSNHFYRNET